MFKAFVIWYNNKVASFLPSAIDTMKAELRATEMSYLENQKDAEEAACNAEMWALKAKHDFKRCKRLQRWIDSEQEAIDREKQTAFDAVVAECLSAFAELDAAIAASEAEAKHQKFKTEAEKYVASNPLAMDDEQFKKAAAEAPKPKPSGFRVDKETLSRDAVAEKMAAQGLKKKDSDKTETTEHIKQRFGL